MYDFDPRIQANRENAKKSTGPITLEGKGKSCLNRLSHGLASNTRLIAGEDPEEFYALLADFIQEYNPATPTEQVLVEDMTLQRWLSLRAFRMQGDVLGDCNTFYSVPSGLAVLIRYQNTANRAFHKAHEALVKAQSQREKSADGFESQTSDAVAQTAAEKPAATAPPVVIQPEITPAEPELTRKMAAGVENFSQAA